MALRLRKCKWFGYIWSMIFYSDMLLFILSPSNVSHGRKVVINVFWKSDQNRVAGRDIHTDTNRTDKVSSENFLKDSLMILLFITLNDG